MHEKAVASSGTELYVLEAKQQRSFLLQTP
jgi:hypothetical protein